LQFTWLLRNENEELFCYDIIGMLYYYKMELQKSKYYHKRFMNGKTVPAGNEQRDFAVQTLLLKEKERRR